MSSRFCFGQQLELLFFSLLFLVAYGGFEVKTKTDQDRVLDPLVFHGSCQSQDRFTGPTHCMKEPKGLLVNKRRSYGFCPYDPWDLAGGARHWGSDTSKDLIHWEHRPVARDPGEVRRMDIEYLKETHVKFDFRGKGLLELLFNNQSDSLLIDDNPLSSALGLDTSRSGRVDFIEGFTEVAWTYLPSDQEETRSLDIYANRSLIEVFQLHPFSKRQNFNDTKTPLISI